MKEVSVEIELFENGNPRNCSLQLPQNTIQKGNIGEDDVKVFIREGVYTQIEELACSDTKKELGSILLGSSLLINGKANVLISDFIEAKYADATASTLTFTHETWNYIHAEQSRLYPGLKIVGWQHTHPGYGVFLSGFDLFIQENFFNLPFQVAYVIDPIRKKAGFFQWKDNKVQKLGGFFLYHDA
jgi:proteasome lid subunit RPN8/RPN11